MAAGKAWLQFALCIALIGVALPFVGTLFVAAATSVPELVNDRLDSSVLYLRRG